MSGRIIATVLICVCVDVLGANQMQLTAEASTSLSRQSEDQRESQLLAIVIDKKARENEPERLIRAIERLGEMRSEAAIPFLIQLLTFKRTLSWESKNVEVDIVDTEHPVTITGRYPAAGALFMIGKPSLPSLVGVIEEQDSDAVSSVNALYTIRQIFRDSPSEVGGFLRSAAAKASSTAKSERLIHAAEAAEKLAQ